MLMYWMMPPDQTKRIVLTEAFNATACLVGHQVLSTLHLVAQGILLCISHSYRPCQLFKPWLSSGEALRCNPWTCRATQAALSMWRCSSSIFTTPSAPDGCPARRLRYWVCRWLWECSWLRQLSGLRKLRLAEHKGEVGW